MATIKNLNFDEGDDFPYLITVKDDSGAVIDLTNSSFIFTCKQQGSDSDDDAIFKKVITSLPYASQGIAVIEIDRDDTAGKSPGIYPYDICWIQSNGDKLTLFKGKFNLSEAMTKEIE